MRGPAGTLASPFRRRDAERSATHRDARPSMIARQPPSGCQLTVDPPTAACLAIARVDELALQPGFEAIGVAQATQIAPGGDQRLLGRVLSPFVVPEDESCDGVEPVAPAASQPVNASRSPTIARSTSSRCIGTPLSVARRISPCSDDKYAKSPLVPDPRLDGWIAVAGEPGVGLGGGAKRAMGFAIVRMALVRLPGTCVTRTDADPSGSGVRRRDQRWCAWQSKERRVQARRAAYVRTSGPATCRPCHVPPVPRAALRPTASVSAIASIA
jgi:hypothetical protein